MSKLYRTSDDCLISGFLGGVAKHIGVDSTILRIVYAVLYFADDLFFGTSTLSSILLIVYIVGWIVVPED